MTVFVTVFLRVRDAIRPKSFYERRILYPVWNERPGSMDDGCYLYCGIVYGELNWNKDSDDDGSEY